jgi:hypothetical protein
VLHCIITRGGISDVLNSHYKKNTEGGEKTKKMRMEKGNREANRYNYGYYGISIFLLKYASYVKKKWYCFVSEDLFEKLWGWERLLPLSGSVKWTDNRSYLEEYYNRNASDFVDGALANQNPEDSQISNNAYMGASLAKSVSNALASLLNHRLPD